MVAPTAAATVSESGGSATIVDKELSDALGAPTIGAAAAAVTAVVVEEIAAPKAITVALPGGSVDGLGVRVEKCDGRPLLVVLSVDPEGIAGKAGVVAGCVLRDIDGVGFEEGLTEEGAVERMSKCLWEVEGGRGATFTFQPPTLH